MVACLVIEMPGLRTPLMGFTAQHPGCILDVALEMRPVGAAFRAICRATGVPPRTMGQLLAEAEAGFVGTRTLLRDDARGLWVGVLGVVPSTMGDPRVVVLAGFLAGNDLSPCWVRVEDGVCFLRAAFPPGLDTQAVLESCRAEMARVGLEGDLGLEEVGVQELAPWIEMIAQASRGDAAGASRPLR